MGRAGEEDRGVSAVMSTGGNVWFWTAAELRTKHGQMAQGSILCVSICFSLCIAMMMMDIAPRAINIARYLHRP
jgi:hypothetical protein